MISSLPGYWVPDRRQSGFRAQCYGMLLCTINTYATSKSRVCLKSHYCTWGLAKEQQQNGEIVAVSRNENDLHLLAFSNRNDEEICFQKENAVKDHREMQRRRKIGLANKGKTPWNKGRKHSAATRERIRQKTIEALRDPKVKKKMSKFPRVHSDQSKARIGFALRRVWGERLEHKRRQERCYVQWAQSIADQAREGLGDQCELEWDSYEKIKAKLAQKQLQLAVEKAKAKEIIFARAERAAKAKKGRVGIARRVKKKKSKQKAQEKSEEESDKQEKSEEESDKLSVFKRLKIKASLTKIHEEAVAHLVACQRDRLDGIKPSSEKWDLEFIGREKFRRQVSLADQIQAVRKSKTALVPVGLKTSTNRSSKEVSEGGS